MKNTTLYLIVLAIAALISRADTASIELLGYGKTRWGMTLQEVLAAESPRVVQLRKEEKYTYGIGLAHIEHLEIASSQFEAVFVFEPTEKKLVQVIVKCLSEKNVTMNRDIYRHLEELLTAKYGPAAYKEDLPARAEGHHFVSWTLGKTKLELDHFFIPDIITSVTVDYEPSEKAKTSSKDL